MSWIGVYKKRNSTLSVRWERQTSYFAQLLVSLTTQIMQVMMQIILERTGDSKWYLKATDHGERSEIAAALVKLSLGLDDSHDTH